MATDDKPLITPQSPSYERAQEEAANPSPVGEAQAVAVLSGLAEAEHDAERAARAAMHVAKDRSQVVGLRLQVGEHQARAQAFDEMVRALGGSPPRAEEVREVLTNGKRAIEGSGSDEALRETLAKMNGELRELYDRALADPHVGDIHRQAIERLRPGE